MSDPVDDPSADDFLPYSIDNLRPTKRRRIDLCVDSESHLQDDSSDGDEYDLPSNKGLLGEEGYHETDERPDAVKSKYLTHVPEYDPTQEPMFVTQLTQPPSSPSRIRAPRWLKKKPTPPPTFPLAAAMVPDRNSTPLEGKSPPQEVMVDDFVDDDHALIEAMFSQSPQKTPTSFRQTTLFGPDTTATQAPSTQSRAHNWPLANRNEPPTHHKLDAEAMKTWVYPTNLGMIRDYQFNIVQRGLFHNLLVALPTGLGKTFIAATIMLNWYRWTKDAQIVFVAPTKPLVKQQIEACFGIVGIPRSQTSMLTGDVQPAIRAVEWQEKRVFFMTPQTLVHDLKTGIADPKKIVLLVVDEAHRATGNYAYVEVVRFLRRFNTSFRVLALTATPGASVEAVQNVIDGLAIARTEIRTEESLDIRQFVHVRNIDTEIFDYTDELDTSMKLFANAIRPAFNKLSSQNAYWSKEPLSITPFGLTEARKQWMKSDAGRKADFSVKGMINAIFNILASLAHGLELLKYHGIGPFYGKLKSFEQDVINGTSKGKYATQIAHDEHFKKLINLLKPWINNPDFVGHPKLSYLKTVVLNHFMDAGEGQGAAGGRPPSDTRIMIFVHFRDSAEEVARVLKRHEPMIRPHVFVGQSSSKDSAGMDQKTQLGIIEKFKKGTYNTLVATSIGEEGLDIGEVDLIVCYDSSASPIRMLQRMGRTGRKRAGNIVALLMRDKEEDRYHKAKDNYEKMQTKIAKGSEFIYHDDHSPRILPREIVPVVDKREIEIPLENTQAELPVPTRRGAKTKKMPRKKFHMPDGVETGFQFLGTGAKSAKKNDKTPKQKRTMENKDLDLAELPTLGDVLLSKEDEERLDHQYCNIGGDEPQYVQTPRVDAFPSLQRRDRKTSKIPHSARTKRLVQTFDSMQDSFKYTARPIRGDLHWSQDEEPEDQRGSDHSAVNSGIEFSGTVAADETPLAPRRKQVPQVQTLHDSDDDLSILDSIPFGKQLAEKPFYVPHQSAGGDDDEELPDITNIVSARKTAPERASQGGEGPRLARRKRVVSDDEDDE